MRHSDGLWSRARGARDQSDRYVERGGALLDLLRGDGRYPQPPCLGDREPHQRQRAAQLGSTTASAAHHIERAVDRAAVDRGRTDRRRW